MTRQPIVSSILSINAFEELKKAGKVQNFIIPTVSNVDKAEAGTHYKFAKIAGSVYYYLAGRYHRVIDISLGAPTRVQTAEGKFLSRSLNIKYIKDNIYTLEKGLCIACNAKDAENMIIDFSKTKANVNVSVDALGKIQSPLITSPQVAKKREEAHVLPEKIEIKDKKSKSTLWKDVFKDLTVMSVQVGGIFVLMFAVYGMLPVHWLVWPALLCMVAPSKVVGWGEKIVQAVPKFFKQKHADLKYIKDCIVYDIQSKDFWGAENLNPRYERKRQKQAKKRFLAEQQQHKEHEKQVSRAVRKSTFNSRIEVMKDAILASRFSKKRKLNACLEHNNSSKDNEYTFDI